MVALYWLLNLWLTYWFISEVFPTLVDVQKRNKQEEGGRGARGNKIVLSFCGIGTTEEEEEEQKEGEESINNNNNNNNKQQQQQQTTTQTHNNKQQ